jgi:hypothetical protein
MDNEIYLQLVQIKWLLMIFVGVALLRVGIAMWWDVKSRGGIVAVFQPRDFPVHASTLLEQNKNEECLQLAQSRIIQFPGDALAFWFKAHAAYRLGKHAEALASIRKVEDLRPDWVSTHVRPFIDYLESQGPRRPASELHVVTPSTPPNPIQ